jgi:hypothetical protein
MGDSVREQAIPHEESHNGKGCGTLARCTVVVGSQLDRRGIIRGTKFAWRTNGMAQRQRRDWQDSTLIIAPLLKRRCWPSSGAAVRWSRCWAALLTTEIPIVTTP